MKKQPREEEKESEGNCSYSHSSTEPSTHSREVMLSRDCKHSMIPAYTWNQKSRLGLRTPHSNEGRELCRPGDFWKSFTGHWEARAEFWADGRGSALAFDQRTLRIDVEWSGS